MKNILLIVMLINICTTSMAQNKAQILGGNQTPEILVASGIDLRLDKEDFDFMQKYQVRYIPYQESCNPLKSLGKRKPLKRNPPIFHTYRDLDEKYGDSWRKEINPKAKFIKEYLDKYPRPSDALMADFETEH